MGFGKSLYIISDVWSLHGEREKEREREREREREFVLEVVLRHKIYVLGQKCLVFALTKL